MATAMTSESGLMTQTLSLAALLEGQAMSFAVLFDVF